MSHCIFLTQLTSFCFLLHPDHTPQQISPEEVHLEPVRIRHEHFYHHLIGTKNLHIWKFSNIRKCKNYKQHANMKLDYIMYCFELLIVPMAQCQHKESEHRTRWDMGWHISCTRGTSST